MLTAAEVKRKARAAGADLVNIVACATLEAQPPDPNWPQVPSRISKRMKTCIITGIRMPWGIFLTDNSTCLSLAAQLLLRKTEKVSLELSYWLEEQGYHAFQVATEETDPALKRGSYGWLSLRHVAVEAGMGTLGLEVNLLTPEFGPRVYNGALLTDAELEPDERIKDQLCIGETCGRCLLACPPNAVLHWGLDKRGCATAAQPDGVASIIYGPLKLLAFAKTDDEVRRIVRSPVVRQKWAALVRLAHSYAACPRCLEVCPVGSDYQAFLAKEHKEIPEKDDARVRKLSDMKAASKAGNRAHYATPMTHAGSARKGTRGSRGRRLSPLTAQEVKRKATELGADLAGIASARVVAEHPVPGCPHAPENILIGARSVVVLARRLLWGMSRELAWDNRNVHYAGELALTKMEDIAYELGRFLEDHDFPSLVTPSAYSRSHQVEIAGKALSLPHLAVEAGLGTLGLNLQLLTPEFGPRVILGAVVTQAELEPDRRRERALCLGEACGRCLLACPGDAIGHWELNLARCTPYSSPFGYHFVQTHVENILASQDRQERMQKVQSMDTFMIWQSMLRGVGIYTGCTRCYDVCPVGADYETHLNEIQEQISEATPEKRERLRGLQTREARPASAGLRAHARWIGVLPDPGPPVSPRH